MQWFGVVMTWVFIAGFAIVGLSLLFGHGERATGETGAAQTQRATRREDALIRLAGAGALLMASMGFLAVVRLPFSGEVLRVFGSLVIGSVGVVCVAAAVALLVRHRRFVDWVRRQPQQSFARAVLDEGPGEAACNYLWRRIAGYRWGWMPLIIGLLVVAALATVGVLDIWTEGHRAEQALSLYGGGWAVFEYIAAYAVLGGTVAIGLVAMVGGVSESCGEDVRGGALLAGAGAALLGMFVAFEGVWV